jgi:NAD-dependent dihydropyrimidine dehydrogenase PreA subunit
LSAVALFLWLVNAAERVEAPRCSAWIQSLSQSTHSHPVVVGSGEYTPAGLAWVFRVRREELGMAFVIAEPCMDVMDQACVRVCPVACIHFDAGTDRKLYIDPIECIDCGACVPVCPVKAIYSDYELPTPWRAYADIDALWFRDKEAARARAAAMKDGR